MPRGIGRAGWLTFEEAESVLEITSEGSGGWMGAICPAHDDNRASLRIMEDDEGYLALTCRAGCATGEVITAIRELLGE